MNTTVLVCSPDEQTLQAVSRVLGAAGYEPVQAATAAGALPLLARAACAVAVVDADPGGLAAVQAMRGAAARLPVIILCTLAGLPLARRAVALGISHLLLLPDDLAELPACVAGALPRRADLAPGPNRGAVVALMGARGGVGTSFLALHLALAWPQLRQSARALLLDLDLYGGQQAAQLGLAPERSWVSLAPVMDELAGEHLTTVTVGIPGGGADLLPAPATPPTAPAWSGAHIRRLVAACRQRYPLTVADLPAAPTPDLLPVLHEADLILWVATADLASVHGLQRRLDWARAAGAETGRMALVVNRENPWSHLGAADLKSVVGVPVLATVPAAFLLIERHAMASQPLLEKGTRGLAGTLLQLARAVARRVEGGEQRG